MDNIGVGKPSEPPLIAFKLNTFKRSQRLHNIIL